jgi:uncharacterized protein involved in response to NO
MPEPSRKGEPPTTRIGGIPRYRETSWPALFSQGFRPFFLAAAIWAPVSLALWMMELAGAFVLPTSFDGAVWHAHEMIFGFATAAMAGFLMTAIPNWTGRMPLQGLPLLLLAMTWLLGRFAVATSALIGVLPAAVLDLAFPAFLTLAIGREIVAGRNWRNLPMIIALGLLLAANAATHLAVSFSLNTETGLRGGLAVLASLIALVGGRIIPSFTRNRLAKARLPAQFASSGMLHRLTLALIPVALAAWTFELSPMTTGFLLLAAGAATLVRLAGWRGWLVVNDPSLLTLHAGHGWLAIGLLLLGVSELSTTVSPLAGLHAVATGAIGTSILGVMARTALSHTGRRDVDPKGAGVLLALIAVAAAARVAATYFSVLYLPLLWIAAIAWILAFVHLLGTVGGALTAPSWNRRKGPGR